MYGSPMLVNNNGDTEQIKINFARDLPHQRVTQNSFKAHNGGVGPSMQRQGHTRTMALSSGMPSNSDKLQYHIGTGNSIAEQTLHHGCICNDGNKLLASHSDNIKCLIADVWL